MTALRIANARKEKPAYSVPDIAVFSKEMRNQESEFHSKLNELFNTESASGRQRLQQGFEVDQGYAFLSLGGETDADAILDADVLLATLPSGVWQVLVFWACSASGETKWDEFRKEAVRFVLFWRLCVWNEEKATVRCFEYLHDNQNKFFPAIELYEKLICRKGDDKSAQELISGEDFSKHFEPFRKLRFGEPTPIVSSRERFATKCVLAGGGAVNRSCRGCSETILGRHSLITLL